MSEPQSPSTESVNDIIDILGSDDKAEAGKKEPVKESKEEPKPKEEEEPEETDDDLELEDPDEEEEEEVEEDKIDLKSEEIQTPPRKKEIEAAFPGFMKKFPWFEKMMYRDREMNELFGSFDGAKEAAEKAQTLDELEGTINSGSSIELFTRIKDNGGDTLTKVVKNLLPNLQKVDKDAYLYVVTDVVKRVLMQANAQGKAAENEDLQNAASIIAGFVFPSGVPEDEKESPIDSEFEKEKQEFQSERLNTAVTEVQSRIGNVLRNTIEQYIDPRDQMTSYVKKTAIRQVLENVDAELRRDLPFRKSVNKLWEDATKTKFSKSSVDKVKSAYLGKAKGLLRKAIIEVRREALKDSAPPRRTEKDGNEEESSKPRRGLIATGRSTSRNSGKPQMKPGESAMDFMMRDD